MELPQIRSGAIIRKIMNETEQNNVNVRTSEGGRLDATATRKRVKSEKRLDMTEELKKKSNKKRNIILACIFVVVIGLYLKNGKPIGDWGQTKIEIMEEQLGKKYDDEFVYLQPGGMASWMDDYCDYTFRSKKYPELPVYVYIYNKYSFYNYDKWDDGYIANKYRDQAKQVVYDMATQIYGECVISMNEWCLPDPQYTVDMSFEEYCGEGISSFKIFVLGSEEHEKESDLENLISECKRKNIVTGFALFYTKELPDDISNYDKYFDACKEAYLLGQVSISYDFSIYNKEWRELKND